MRAHLEEDAAKTVHAGGATGRSRRRRLLARRLQPRRHAAARDRERARPPLGRRGDRYLRLLRQTIVELGISDAEMEKGTLRADVNVSVRKRGEEGFRPALGAEEHELVHVHPPRDRGCVPASRSPRTSAARRSSSRPTTTTPTPTGSPCTARRRRRTTTATSRSPTSCPSSRRRSSSSGCAARLRELPGARIRRLTAELGFDVAYALVTTGNECEGRGAGGRGSRLEDGGRGRDEPRQTSCPRTSPRWRGSSRRTSRATRSTRRSPRRPTGRSRRTRTRAGRRSATSPSSSPVIDAVIAANPEQVETYRGGKEGVLGFLVGQVMKETQGKADPKVVNRLLREKLRG